MPLDQVLTLALPYVLYIFFVPVEKYAVSLLALCFQDFLFLVWSSHG